MKCENMKKKSKKKKKKWSTSDFGVLKNMLDSFQDLYFSSLIQVGLVLFSLSYCK